MNTDGAGGPRPAGRTRQAGEGSRRTQALLSSCILVNQVSRSGRENNGLRPAHRCPVMSRLKGEGSLYLLPDHARSRPGGRPASGVCCKPQGGRPGLATGAPRPLPAPRPPSCSRSGRHDPVALQGLVPSHAARSPVLTGLAVLVSEPRGQFRVQRQTRAVSPGKCWTQLRPEPGPRVCPSPGPGLRAPDAVSAE